MRKAALAAVSFSLACAHGAVAPEVPPPLGKEVRFALPLLSSAEEVEVPSPGKVVLVAVWATWCDVCRDSLAAIQELERELGPRGLAAFALDVDADPRKVPEFVEGAGVRLPVLLDTDAHVSERVLGVRQVPSALVFDRRGVVRKVEPGFDPERLRALRPELEGLLAEP